MSDPNLEKKLFWTISQEAAVLTIGVTAFLISGLRAQAGGPERLLPGSGGHGRNRRPRRTGPQLPRPVRRLQAHGGPDAQVARSEALPHAPTQVDPALIVPGARLRVSQDECGRATRSRSTSVKSAATPGCSMTSATPGASSTSSSRHLRELSRLHLHHHEEARRRRPLQSTS